MLDITTLEAWGGCIGETSLVFSLIYLALRIRHKFARVTERRTSCRM